MTLLRAGSSGKEVDLVRLSLYVVLSLGFRGGAPRLEVAAHDEAVGEAEQDQGQEQDEGADAGLGRANVVNIAVAVLEAARVALSDLVVTIEAILIVTANFVFSAEHCDVTVTVFNAFIAIEVAVWNLLARLHCLSIARPGQRDREKCAVENCCDCRFHIYH